jgi:uncharacterized protein YndB with AHSA1/START domain
LAKVIAASIEIEAPVARVFAIVANPHMHPKIDGSGTLKADVEGPLQLRLGDEFIVDVHQFMSYPTVNVVIEFEQDHLIAWKHIGPQAWRYRFEALAGDRTRVTEEFDYGRYGPFAILFKWSWGGHKTAMEQTLVKLKDLAEADGA